jgi:hypothetical protein
MRRILQTFWIDDDPAAYARAGRASQVSRSNPKGYQRNLIFSNPEKTAFSSCQ